MNRSTPAPAPSRGLSALSIVAIVLLIVGGLNWALVGLFGFDLVATVFGGFNLASRAVYVLVGISAVAAIFMLPRITRLS
ncbi:MAG TPA: DUF378 domain-containing protein [Methylibium sp.]|uniref:DUF378 domain-containing protein n=1 Tax=Methylibium sp. TaxID=2067992 RepID=UPI002DB8A46F|nr:DUF378 domain-containing protein [Methylibium sp.]HEU4459094.1 DUF378 domain-containing protein [Methylibium sp.]